MRAFPLCLLLMLTAVSAHATGLVRGRVIRTGTNEPVPYATVRVLGTPAGAVTSEQGLFEIRDVPDGLWDVQVSQIGYRPAIQSEVEVSAAQPVALEIAIEEQPLRGDTLTVTASSFRRPPESPVSLRSLGAAEIERFPGADRDPSRVLQSQPGVATSASFRNDLLVRGGAPNENRFVLEGIEVPVINHFATQGSTGGPVGMIDVNGVREVELFTSAFPASRGGALSSVTEFQLKEGNDQRMVTRGTVGASDAGVSLDGPLGPRARLTLSARRSYLQFVASAIGLPFLPTYNDAQFRLHVSGAPRDEFDVIGVGAADQFRLNLDATDTEFKRWALDQLPVTPQWNYTLGARWKRFGANGVRQLVVSRSQLDNRATKYRGNDESDPANLTLDYRSQEIQDRVRAEWSRRAGAWRTSWGAGAEQVTYTNRTYQKTAVPTGLLEERYDSRLTFPTYALFAQASRDFAGDRGTASFGARADGAAYSRLTRDPLEQLSPRLALTWRVAGALRAGASLARYHQLPPWTVLGWRDAGGALANRDAGARWIRADHVVAGLEWSTRTNARLSAGGFLKRYAHYPFLLREQVSLANLGADFGVIGNAPVDARSRGRTWGVELLAQQRLWRGWYGIAAYTWVRSEFTGAAGTFAPSAWDHRHVVSLNGGRRFGGGWEVGGRWRYLGGAPYTPDDLELSSRREVWDATGRAVADWSRLNSGRNGVLHQLDLRVDKRWVFARTELAAYVDVQNVYAFAPRTAPLTVLVRDANAQPVVDPSDPSRYLLKTLPQDPGVPFPTIGLRFTF